MFDDFLVEIMGILIVGITTLGVYSMRSLIQKVSNDKLNHVS